MVKNANFSGFLQNLRVFAYIGRGYQSAAESTSLLSPVASLAIICSCALIGTPYLSGVTQLLLIL